MSAATTTVTVFDVVPRGHGPADLPTWVGEPTQPIDISSLVDAPRGGGS
jgi:hypothetical protein